MKKNNKKKYTYIYLKKLEKKPLSKLNNKNKNIYMKTHKKNYFHGRSNGLWLRVTQPLQQRHSNFFSPPNYGNFDCFSTC